MLDRRLRRPRVLWEWTGCARGMEGTCLVSPKHGCFRAHRGEHADWARRGDRRADLEAPQIRGALPGEFLLPVGAAAAALGSGRAEGLGVQVVAAARQGKWPAMRMERDMCERSRV